MTPHTTSSGASMVADAEGFFPLVEPISLVEPVETISGSW
jgi:hypothetical protein